MIFEESDAKFNFKIEAFNVETIEQHNRHIYEVTDATP